MSKEKAKVVKLDKPLPAQVQLEETERLQAAVYDKEQQLIQLQSINLQRRQQALHKGMDELKARIDARLGFDTDPYAFDTETGVGTLRDN